MKATILNQSKTIATVVTIMFSAFTYAGTIENEQEAYLKESGFEISGGGSNTNLKKQEVNIDAEIKFMDSMANHSLHTNKEIVNRILENEQIIESNAEVTPSIYLNKTVEEMISEDNTIIESNLDNQTHPLDFDLINKLDNHNKTADFKTVFSLKGH